MKKSKEATAYTVDNSLRKEKLGLKTVYPLMSKRFYAACAAMQGILSNSDLRTSILLDSHNAKCMEEELLVDYAYNYADELLKRENE